MNLDELKHYKDCIVEFKNTKGDVLTITTVANNKYPTLGIKKKADCTIYKIGELTNPKALITWLKGEDFNEEDLKR